MCSGRETRLKGMNKTKEYELSAVLLPIYGAFGHPRGA